MTDAVELVDAIGKAGGTHPGHRAAHAKGVLLTGTFTPSEEARSLTALIPLMDIPSRRRPPAMSH